MKLISGNKLSDHVALLLLSSLPFNIRQTSEDMLQELQVRKTIVINKAVRHINTGFG